MDDNKGLPYFFLGLGVGVAVGMIFAPKAGAETRTLIRTRATEGGDYIRRRGTELREGATDLIDKSRKGATDLIDKSKSAVTRQKEQFGAALDAGRQAYRDTVSGQGGPTPPADINPTPEGI